jgi:hypothetical protein
VIEMMAHVLGACVVLWAFGLRSPAPRRRPTRAEVESTR